MRVGLFDSGVGGLSVLKSIYEAGLFEELIYYGDIARLPYGTKDEGTIIRFCLEALDFFVSQKIDLLILACNSASAVAIEALRRVAPFEIYGVIEAGVAAAARAADSSFLKKENKTSREGFAQAPAGASPAPPAPPPCGAFHFHSPILIIATSATIRSGAYQRGLAEAGFSRVRALATPLFVPMVEEGIFEGPLLRAAFEHYFGEATQPPAALILACTHFPLIGPALQDFFGPATRLIHSGEAMVEFLRERLGRHAQPGPARLVFHASAEEERLKRLASQWLNLKGQR